MPVPMKRWLTMKWTDLQGHVGEKVAVLPIGSVEQHGPHLPLGTNSLIPVGLADRLAASAPNLANRLIMMPPPIIPTPNTVTSGLGLSTWMVIP